MLSPDIFRLHFSKKLAPFHAKANIFTIIPYLRQTATATTGSHQKLLTEHDHHLQLEAKLCSLPP